MVEDIERAEYIRHRDDNDQWQLIDVREDWEIEIASITGATVISMREILSRQFELDKESPVAVICHSGGRSGRVADFLFQQGFPKVANIAGGIDAWSLVVDSTVRRCWQNPAGKTMDRLD